VIHTPLTTSNYTLIRPPEPQQTLIHVYPGAEELGRVYRPALGINSGMKPFLKAAAGLNARPGDRAVWLKDARAEYEEWNDRCSAVPGDVHMGEIVLWLRETLGPDAFICNGAGNFSSWFHRFYRYRHYRTQLAPTSGSMGYGPPAAVAAKILHPDREAIAVSGDGDFMMHGQEFATAVQHGPQWNGNGLSGCARRVETNLTHRALSRPTCHPKIGRELVKATVNDVLHVCHVRVKQRRSQRRLVTRIGWRN